MFCCEKGEQWGAAVTHPKSCTGPARPTQGSSEPPRDPWKGWRLKKAELKKQLWLQISQQCWPMDSSLGSVTKGSFCKCTNCSFLGQKDRTWDWDPQTQANLNTRHPTAHSKWKLPKDILAVHFKRLCFERSVCPPFFFNYWDYHIITWLLHSFSSLQALPYSSPYCFLTNSRPPFH